jgi:RHS repeat-associated protein
VRGEAAAASVFYVHSDYLNTPRVLTNKQNRIPWRWDNADPFGANIASEDPDTDYIYLRYPLRFPGQYFDNETRLHYNYFRDYDPSTGRYLQSDPIGVRGGINSYVYARGNPSTATDPLGLFPIETIWDVGNIIYDIITGSWGDLVVDSIAAATPYVPAGLSKLRKIPQATKCVADASNYRKLFKESRPDLPDDWVIHHSIPQRYEEFFRVADLNIHDLQFLRGVDPRLHSKITGEWEAFHRGMGKDPTAAQVAEFAKQIDTKYGEKFVWPGY